MLLRHFRSLSKTATNRCTLYQHCPKNVFGTVQMNIKSQFDEDGYLFIPDALNKDEITSLLRWTAETEEEALNQKEFSKNNIDVPERRGLHHFETDKLTQTVRICRSERLVDFHTGFKGFLCDGKVKNVVSQCFGEEAVLYKEKINYKYPFCGAFKAHQDALAYPNVQKAISCAISIDGSDERNGCLEIAKGRHKEGAVGKNEEGIICDNIAENVENREPLVYERVPTNPGDMIIFDGYAPHRSGINKSDKPRRIIYATYNPLSEGDKRAEYYERKRKDMLDGKISFIFDFDGNIVSTIGK